MITKKFNDNRFELSLKAGEKVLIEKFKPFDAIHLYLKQWSDDVDEVRLKIDFLLNDWTLDIQPVMDKPDDIFIILEELDIDFPDIISFTISCNYDINELVCDLED